MTGSGGDADKDVQGEANHQILRVGREEDGKCLQAANFQADGHFLHAANFQAYPSTGNLSSCFFLFGGELISVCSYSLWRRSNYF